MSALNALFVVSGLFAGMLLCFELGRRIGAKRLRRDSKGVAIGSGPVEASVFGLLGLLLAFSFSGAASRFEERRHLITEEANAIGTAYLRLDLLAEESQPALRGLFRQYVEARAQVYRNTDDVDATQRRLAAATELQRQIWSRSVTAAHQPGTPAQAAMLLLPALNQMIDLTTTRAVALRNHPPRVIYFLLGSLSLFCALLIGYVMSATVVRSWFYILLVAGTLSLTLYVILDLEYPRHGLVRVDSADDILLELRQLMR